MWRLSVFWLFYNVETFICSVETFLWCGDFQCKELLMGFELFSRIGDYVRSLMCFIRSATESHNLWWIKALAFVFKEFLAEILVSTYDFAVVKLSGRLTSLCQTTKTPFGETPWLTGHHAMPLVTLFFGVTMLLTGHHAMPVVI